MPIFIEATYENGVLVPESPLPLAEHGKVRLTIHPSVPPQPAADIVDRTYGLVQVSDPTIIQRIALDPEFGILESP